MDFGLLRVKFLSSSPVGDNWTKDIATESSQQDVLAATLFNEVLKDRPISHTYMASFMKTFMSKIEEFGGEIYDCTYEAFGDIVSSSPSEIEYKHYVLDDKTVCIQETNLLVAEGTTGLRTWQASQHLAEYLMANSSLLDNKNVLELGCGVGFLGLSLCSVCRCESYVLSDHHPSVLRKVNANISNNEMQLLCVPTVESVDWNIMASDDAAPTSGNLDILLAADVVYDDTVIPSLARTIRKILTNNEHCRAFIASTIRNKDTHDSFIKSITDLELKVTEVKSSAAKIFIYDESSPISITCISMGDA